MPPKTSARVARRLAALRADYELVRGRPFQRFFCPMLYRDDPATELCEAHIVNRAFGASSTWTIQRKDVDGFFGSAFESDFVVLRHRGRAAAEAIGDRALAKQFRPSIVADGKPIEFYGADGRPVPKDHSRMILAGSEGETNLVLKMPPEDVAALMNGRWGIQIERDIRVPAMVSLLKAAHLTLFHMLGYRYVFSAGGRFLGHDILGKFFFETAGRAKPAVAAAAHPHFHEFVHMVRPMLGHPMPSREQRTIRWSTSAREAPFVGE